MDERSTGSEGVVSRWTSDTRHVLAQWKMTPFVGHRHRHERIEVRVVLEYTHGVGVDVLLQARSADSRRIPSEWSTVESLEGRTSVARYDRAPEARWLD